MQSTIRNYSSPQSFDYSGGLTPEENNITDLTKACPLCSNKTSIFDPERSELICSSCGTVIFESSELVAEVTGTHFENNSKNINAKSDDYQSLALHDRGLSTFISGSNSDAHGNSFTLEQKGKAYKLRKWNNISHANVSYHRNLKNAFILLSIIRDKLSLTDVLIEKSAYHYRKACEKQLIKGRSIVAFIVASTYVSCREQEIPRSIDEIANAVNADPIFAGKCYRKLLRYLKLRPYPIDSATYLSKIAKNSRISEKSYRTGLKILKAVKGNAISYGKAPNALASAILYFACIEEGENVAQQNIALAAGVSVVTLRKRIDDVEKVISLNDARHI